MSSYKAMEVNPQGTITRSSRELQAPPAGHVRIAVEACGVCHTDSFTVHPHEDSEGRVPGHEIVGHIDAIGSDVTAWNVGDRVGVGFLGGHCGVCEQCRRGNFMACTDQPLTGLTVDGGYAEYTIARASGLVSVPSDAPADVVAPLLCAGFTTFNALVKADPKPGDVVAIHGIGGLGHLAIQYAKAVGAHVVAVARGTAKEELSRQLGADDYIDAAAGDPVAALNLLGAANIVISTVASGSAASLVGGLKQGGRLVVLGSTDEPVSVPAHDLVFRQITILGSLTGSAIENEDNLAFALAHGIAPLIQSSKLDEADDSYNAMMRGDARFRNVLTIAN